MSLLNANNLIGRGEDQQVIRILLDAQRAAWRNTQRGAQYSTQRSVWRVVLRGVLRCAQRGVLLTTSYVKLLYSLLYIRLLNASHLFDCGGDH